MQNRFCENFSIFYREITVRQSLSNTLKSPQAVRPAVRLVYLLKKDPLTGVSELAVCRSWNRCSGIIYKIHKKATVFESIFK